MANIISYRMSVNENHDVSTNSEEEKTVINENPNSSFLNTEYSNEESGRRRQSCKFGTKCFRQNPRHRLDMAHPGDSDYIVPNMPEPNEGATKCKYGRHCYRLNPEHFQNFAHPRNINIQSNYKKYCLKNRLNRADSNSSSGYDVSDDDPFAGDSGGSDYIPSEDE